MVSASALVKSLVKPYLCTVSWYTRSLIEDRPSWSGACVCVCECECVCVHVRVHAYMCVYIRICMYACIRTRLRVVCVYALHSLNRFE